MKRIIAILLLVLLLCGCGTVESTVETPPPTESPAAETPAPTEEAPSYHFTRENMPRLDGSTSTAPLAEAVCSALLGESREDVGDLIQFSKTTNAYFNLLSGEADLLIVGEANDEVYEEKERLGFEWEQTPFATDAFVFVVNESNPVSSITVEQARKIYTGEITNWKELGGEDREIIPFQRNSGAGSQTLMEKLVMDGQPMMEAPTDYVVGSMGQLMEAVKSYDGSPGAIGYSVYYYAEEMKMAQGLKMLALEGVEPTPDTIRSETYPLINPKYVVIPADAAEDAPNRILYNWLLSEEGQKLVAQEGYVSILEVDTASRSVPLVGSRMYEGYTDHLIVRDDYGMLIPYAGQRLADDWPAATGCTYGLMTSDGVAVTDPVYSRVTRPGYYTDGVLHTLPLLVLTQGYKDGGSDWVTGRIAVAGADGSWCTGFDYDFMVASRYGLVLFTETELTLMAPDGSIEAVMTSEDMGITQEEWYSMRNEARDGVGYGGQRLGDYLSISATDEGNYSYIVKCYDISSGELLTMPLDDWWDMYEELSEAGQEYESPVENAYPLTDVLLGDGTPVLLERSEYTDAGLVRTYYRGDGTPLPELTQYGYVWYQQVSFVGGLIEVLDLNTASYYDPDTMECVFRAYLNYEMD